jgi:hypothetical protein
MLGKIINVADRQPRAFLGNIHQLASLKKAVGWPSGCSFLPKFAAIGHSHISNKQAFRARPTSSIGEERRSLCRSGFSLPLPSSLQQKG